MACLDFGLHELIEVIADQGREQVHDVAPGESVAVLGVGEVPLGDGVVGAELHDALDVQPLVLRAVLAPRVVLLDVYKLLVSDKDYLRWSSPIIMSFIQKMVTQS